MVNVGDSVTDAYLIVWWLFCTMSCREWRSPSVVWGYRNITENLAREYGIPYLSTDFLLGPVWDSPTDWCHYAAFVSGQAGKEEARYLLSRLRTDDPQ